MSAGVCGKRLGFEEIFGSSTSSSSSAAKRFRCSNFGSPVRSSEFGFGSEDKLLFLIRMFPNTDPEALSQSDGRWRYNFNGAESSTYAAGLALESLAGVISLASSELDESMVGVAKNDIRKLLKLLKNMVMHLF